MKHQVKKGFACVLASAALLVGTALPNAAQAAEGVGIQSKHIKDNKALVTAYMKAVFVDRNLGEVEKYWGKDMVQHNPTMPNGHDVLRGLIGKIGPDFKYEQGLIAQNGNFVMVHGRYIGWGPKPMIAVDIFRIENGKIVEHWDVMQEEVAADKSVNGHSMFPAK